MLGLINNIRFDRLERSKQYSFKTDLENYNLSELDTNNTTRIDNKYLSANWISIFRKQ
jgi:hypothetical protein|tara:strand:- start:35 stop:208 length:174 start_codon:yes stop_codon:yes gene_type:complete